MKVKHQLELLYFQVDKDLVCMNIISAFHIIVIIYQSFNINIYEKIWTIFECECSYLMSRDCFLN
jgi:hypothetical protein